MADAENELFRYIDNEESLTDFFVSFLARSDVAHVLNSIHDELEFDSTARLVATQRDGLDRHPEENDRQRTLDWVVADREKIVGYEAKRGDKLTTSQLRAERRKLEANARGKEIHLFAITEGLRKPDLDVGFSWMSWSDVGKRINDIDDESPITELMADMLRDNGYDGFRGFTPYERDEGWLIKHQNEAVDFALEAAEYADGLRFYDKHRIDLHNRVQNDVLRVKNKDYYSFGPSFYVFPTHPIGYRDADTDYNISGNSWYIAITVPALHNTVYVQMNVYLSKKEAFRKLFAEHAAELRDIVVSNDMTVWTSWNSLNKEDTPDEYHDPEAIYDIFKKKGGEGRFKRIRMGWEIDADQTPDEMISEAAEKMERLHEIFYEGVQRRKQFDRPERDQEIV